MSTASSISSAALFVAVSLMLQGCVPLPEKAKVKKFRSMTVTTTSHVLYPLGRWWTVTSTTRTYTTDTDTTTTPDPLATTTFVSTTAPTATTVRCTEYGEDCSSSRCCANETMQCYVKDETWSSCKPSCEPGKIDPNDPPGFFSPWECRVLSRMPDGWINGTYTTGYWDCCKPSCSWLGKGHVDGPARSCATRTHEYLWDPEVTNVCTRGGTASGCTNNQPFEVNDNLSMGFAAAAVGGAHGLVGDENCGQCFELRFTDQQHLYEGRYGGGSHPSLVGKTMIVQVNNIGYDVYGEHSFDIQIPGAGQGIFEGGCATQFPGFNINDFDCGNRYGGCDHEGGCERLPLELRPGCVWRFRWYKWMVSDGSTDNPYISFRRVRCPKELTDISGSTPLDDLDYPTTSPRDYR